MEKLKRAISKEHDYVSLNNDFKVMSKMIQSSTRKTFDSVQNYIDLYIKTIGVREGLQFLGLTPYRQIATITGARKYHQNFLFSLEEHINFLRDELTEKSEKLQNETSKIGFKR